MFPRLDIVSRNFKMAGQSQTTSPPEENNVQDVIVTVVGIKPNVPQGCIIEQSDGFKPWDNPQDLISHESGFFLQYTVGLTGFLWVSQFLTCVIACERCFCVFSPLKAQKYLKTSTMAWVILVTSVFLVGGIALTAGYKLIFICVFDPITNQTSSGTGFTSAIRVPLFPFTLLNDECRSAEIVEEAAGIWDEMPNMSFAVDWMRKLHRPTLQAIRLQQELTMEREKYKMVEKMQRDVVQAQQNVFEEKQAQQRLQEVE
ncbi:hypothetical protein C0Q70_13546 [Pomacea canaliculata]|uniref:Uncharacterized protein n=1 Tax=Pomacea canaliculata TaxID=400727 RepID=A0A2T7NXI8_POMCA|nr:hypothetical protein C0Q70_13546 [Pomacea canaliculata]